MDADTARPPDPDRYTPASRYAYRIGDHSGPNGIAGFYGIDSNTRRIVARAFEELAADLVGQTDPDVIRDLITRRAAGVRNGDA